VAIGGTNILDMAADEVYTSYDFAAPISEFGEIRDNFRKAKEINYFLDSFDLTETENLPHGLDLPQNCFAKIRRDNINHCTWRFFRNLNHCETNIDGVWVDAFDMKILPENLKLNAVTILSSGLEIFARVLSPDRADETVFFISDYKNSIKILSDDGLESVISGDVDDFYEINFEKSENGNIKRTKFIFISRKIAYNTWKMGQKLIFGASFVYPDNKIAIDNETEIKIYRPKTGFETKCLTPKLSKKKINLTHLLLYIIFLILKDLFSLFGHEGSFIL